MDITFVCRPGTRARGSSPPENRSKRQDSSPVIKANRLGGINMRFLLMGVAAAFASLASSQQVTNVYDRDNHSQFKLKAIKVYSTAIGPIVRTSAQYTYDNPQPKNTEASVWFELPTAAALSGFSYYYKDEYVPGVLMDKNKAWFIYTAITSRNEDPGILDMKSPSSFHAQ